MYRMLKYRLLPALLLLFAAGCTREFPGIESPDPAAGELPVVFDLSWSELPGTRAFGEEENVRTKFRNGDVIHILGTFKTRALQENGNYVEGEMTRYGILQYDGKNWRAAPEDENSALRWPSIAVSGTFVAYCISGSNGILTLDNPSATYLLSEVTPATDPLKAVSANDIDYGHAVKLSFAHLCTHLTLLDLEPMVAEAYWFYRPDASATFNNAFRIVLKEDAQKRLSLDFEFLRQPDTSYNGLVYIASDVERIYVGDDSDPLQQEKVISKAGYFLEPGRYDTFSLCYPTIAPATIEYLKYDYNKVPEEAGGSGKPNNEPDLKANTTYTLTITKAPGVTVVNPPAADGWDETGSYKDVDVEDFLKAVNEGRAYENKDGEAILEKTANGTRLLCNVDFKNFHYDQFRDESFFPNIPEGREFDGDHHYIENLVCPLFRYNYGTIRNIGIQHVEIEATSYEIEYEADGADMSRHGSLCMWNRTNAVIQNVRAADVKMTVTVESKIESGQDNSETHNIGGLIGSNTGKVSEVALSGEFAITVQGGEGDAHDVNASVLIGGVAGQNVGSISDVSPLTNDLSIRITNTCFSEFGAYSVGGVVGESSGDLAGVILSNVTVDGSRSVGTVSYMGGIAGKLEVVEGTATVEDCIVGGSVTAGITKRYGALTSGSYIGGLAGVDLQVAVTGCRGTVAVTGSAEAYEQVIYATGGAFGRIRENTGNNYEFKDLIAYGSVLAAPVAASTVDPASLTSYTGNFAGIVPVGEDNWNFAERVIYVYRFAGIPDVGIAMNSDNQAN